MHKARPVNPGGLCAFLESPGKQNEGSGRSRTVMDDEPPANSRLQLLKNPLEQSSPDMVPLFRIAYF